ncbi:MAG: triose-phosphate isomerase [Thermoplasmatota archaeon]
MRAFPKPLVVVNYKTYTEASGGRAVDLTRALAEAWKATEGGGSLLVAPPLVDLRWVAHATSVPVIAQHVDALGPGLGTGRVTVEAVKEAGAVGSILNHAEHRLPQDQVAEAIRRLHVAGMLAIVCAKDHEEAHALAKHRPDYVAVEPPELIGGTVSVTTAEPDIVRRSADAVRSASPDVGVLCGAGVKTGDDMAAALGLGTDGVLLASGIAKAKDPAGALRSLIEGMRRGIGAGAGRSVE